jgi:hypothetical protein
MEIFLNPFLKRAEVRNFRLSDCLKLNLTNLTNSTIRTIIGEVKAETEERWSAHK